MIDKALEIAIQAHKGQKDKAGKPYILHPLRVMMDVGGECMKAVAILHDVVEDSDITIEQLREQLKEEIEKDYRWDIVINSVDCLTKRKEERLTTYYKKILEDKTELAAYVKLADLEDNMDITRLKEFGEKDSRRLDIYHYWWNWLQDRTL